MKRSKHSLSYYKLLSCDMGELVPIGCTEVLPGDSIQQVTNLLVRLAPMLSPVMHPVTVRTHHWFVPYRLIWDDFEDFITGGPDGMDSSDYPTKAITAAGSGVVGQLADYLGVPTGLNVTVSALPFRAYNMIFNEWYRDQDLVTPVAVSTLSGVDATTSTALLRAAWEKDRFTSARPWEQKGPSITIPIGTSAPVTGTVGLAANGDFLIEAEGQPLAFGPIEPPTTVTAGAANALNVRNDGSVSWSSGVDARYRSGILATPSLTADLSGASAINVNLLREAMALQRYEEARARYGSRYVEYLRYLGIRSSDARLQRPEFLGGGQQMIQFSEVLQTAEGTDPVGEMRGHGIGASRTNRYRRFFEEHGIIMTLMSVRPKTIYSQGLSRMWNRRTKEDFYQMELAHIGQAEVQNKEVYAAHTSPDGVFGYQDRYDEYRSNVSSVAGEFRTSILNDWHMAREFSSDPALNSTFVQCVPTERVFASSTNDVLYVMARHSIQARRIVAAQGNSFIY